MIEKIFKGLKQKYPQFGLADEVLRAHATMLNALGYVNDDNLESVLDLQKQVLADLQTQFDKRATEAVRKSKGELAEAQKLIEELKNKLPKTAPEPEPTPSSTPTQPSSEIVPTDLLPRSFVEKMLADASKQYEEQFQAIYKQMHEMQSAEDKRKKVLDSLKAENDQMKLEKAKAERNAFITNSAKELGIPEWRISEGFALADDATNDSIKDTLSTIANNIKVAGLQQNSGRILAGAEVSKEEINAIADRLLK